MFNNRHCNPYMDAAMKNLKDSAARAEELSKALTPETIDEYTKAAGDTKSALIDLAKIGANMSRDEDGCISIQVNDDDVLKVKPLHIQKYMSEEEKAIVENNITFWAEKPIEDYVDDFDEYDEPDVVDPAQFPFNSMQMAPYLPMMQYMPNVKASEIVKDLSALQQKILSFERSQNNTRESNYKTRHKLVLVKDELANVQKELADKTEALENLKKERQEERDRVVADSNVYREKVDTLEETIRNLRGELSEKDISYRSQLSNKDNIINNGKADIERLEKLKAAIEADNEKATAKAEEKIKALEKEIESLKASIQSKIEAAKKEEAAKYGDVGELKQQLAMIKSNNEKSQDFISKLKTERDEKNKRISELENAKNNLQKEFEKKQGELLSEIEKLKADAVESSHKVEELEKLAYTDSKTRVMNANAFNRDFKEKTISKNLCVSMVGICGVKAINDTYGRGAGDNLIAIVANKLVEYFDISCIYKVIGDQFVIIHENSEYGKVNFALTDIQKELAMSDIKIVFGVANGEYCKSHAELLQTVEKSMENMKLEKERIFEPLDNARAESLSRAEEIKVDTTGDIDSSIAAGLAGLEE